jgi:very-short-patch-repair endonuclease
VQPFRRPRGTADRDVDESGRGGPERRPRPGGWREVDVVAARQHGVVTSAQLAAAGITLSAVKSRLRSGALRRLHRGVYRVGPIEAPWAREMAALLATGEGAVLSHHSAADVWEILPRHDGPAHVTVRGHAVRARAGLHIHRSHSLDAAVHRGLPLTAPARTLRDLAAYLAAPALERAVEQALVARLTSHAALAAQTGRGAARLRGVLSSDPAMTRSEAERRLLALVRAARLPQPETNVRLGRYEVDMLWRRQRLVVEVDGFAYHGSRRAFERDRRRDADLTQAGYRVVRFTWRQITQEPEAVVARLAALIAAARR